MKAESHIESATTLSGITALLCERTILEAESYAVNVLWQAVREEMGRIGIPSPDSYRKHIDRHQESLDDLARAIIRTERQQLNATPLQDIFQHSFDSIVLYDFEQQEILDCNQATLDMLGYSKSELLEIDPLAIADPATVNEEAYNRDFNMLLSKIMVGEKAQFDQWYVRKSGERFMANVQMLPVKHGGTSRVLFISKDLSDVMEREARIKQGQENISTIYEMTPLGIAIIDQEGIIMTANPAFYSTFGYLSEELEDQPFSILHESDLSEEELQKAQDLRDGRISVMEVEREYVTKKGEILMCRIWVSITREGETSFYVACIQDFSKKHEQELRIAAQMEELNKKNQQLEEYIKSNLELERFAYMASHDLRQPLRSIAGFTQLLERQYVHLFDERAKEYMDFIKGSVNSMDALISDLLTYSRVNTQELDVKELNLPHLLQSVTDMFKLTGDCNVEFHIGEMPQSIIANHTKMKQLFQNLIGNAIKFHKPGVDPVVEIDYKAQKRKHLFLIKDNGIGIAEEYLNKVFLIFQRLHTQEKYEGTGIGLAVCKKIVQQHGGEIHVSSETGKGSTFYFTIRKGLEGLR